jgi:hypothetical protein
MDNEQNDQMDMYYTPQGLVDKLTRIATANEMAMARLVNPPFTTGLREQGRLPPNKPAPPRAE